MPTFQPSILPAGAYRVSNKNHDYWIVDADGNIIGQTGANGQDTFFASYQTDSSGNVVGLLGPNGEAVQPINTTAYAKKPRVLKRFNDLANVSITVSTLTVTSSIDQLSPFGGPALKLVLAPPSGGYVNIDITNVNIADFDGNIAATVWLDEVHRLAQYMFFECADGTFTDYSSWTKNLFAAGDMVGGGRVLFAGPMSVGVTKTNNGAGFTPGTSDLKTVRLRINAYAGANTTVWIKDIFIPAKQRPIVCFTYDDGYTSWMTKVLPILAANSVKATFCINSASIPGGVTNANIQELSAAGHQISCHNVNNYALLRLGSNGNGIIGGATAIDSPAYATEYHTARQVLEALGIPVDDLTYHAWVQGGVDTQGASLLNAAGVELARTTSPYEVQPYGFPMYNNAMDLLAWPLGSTKTLVQNKAAVDQCVKYGGLMIFMGHDTAATSSDSITYSETELAELVAYVKAQDIDVLTMKELLNTLSAMGALKVPDVNPSPAVRMIGHLAAANMNNNSTDQTITLPTGSWVITQCYAAGSNSVYTATFATNVMTVTGVTTGAVGVGQKITATGVTGGTTITADLGGNTWQLSTSPGTLGSRTVTAVSNLTTAAGGIYTGAGKGGTAFVAAGQVYTALTGTVTDVATLTPVATPTVSGSVYLNLTTAQGSGATADIFVYGRPA